MIDPQIGLEDIDLSDVGGLKEAAVDWEQANREIEVAKETAGYLAFKGAAARRKKSMESIAALIGDKLTDGDTGRIGPYSFPATWNASKEVDYETAAKMSFKVERAQDAE